MKSVLSLLGLSLLLLAACSRELVKDEIALERYKEADVAYAEGRYEECIPHYEYVIRWRDRIFDAYIKLGSCYEQVGRQADSTAILKRLLQVDPTNVDGMRALAHAYEKGGDLSLSIQMHQKILDAVPGDKQAWKDLLRLRGESRK